MAGYEDTRQMIINTLTNRLAGTEIQPGDHQEFALAITDYVRSVELLSGNAFIGFAEANTTPVQSDKGQCFYISTVGPGQTVNFVNFIDSNGNVISVSSPDGKMSLVTLIWNTQYWSSQVTTIDTNWSIAQQSGDSESMVMSQKAVTDAIAEVINKLITTDRIEDGAVTTEKIATSAFDSTLSVSGKIAPANIVGEKLTELEKYKDLIVVDDYKADLDIADEEQNIIARFKDGHIKTKNFDSRNITEIGNSTPLSDLQVVDDNENIILELKDGHIKTKNFDSSVRIKRAYTPNYERFKVMVNQTPIPNDNTRLNPSLGEDGEDFAECTGVIALPPIYTHDGEPCKLILFAHGGHGYVDESRWYPTNTNFQPLVTYLLSMGYAVFDCNGYKDTPYNEWIKMVNNGNVQISEGMPQVCEAYWKCYQYIIAHYNVNPNIYIWGCSQGGHLAMNFAYTHRQVVSAIAMAAGQIDLYDQGYAYQTLENKRQVAKLLGFTNTTFTTNSEALEAYEHDKADKFDPMKRIVTIGDKDYFLGWNTPIKFFYGTNDTTLPQFQYTERAFNALKNSCAVVYMRWYQGFNHDDVAVGAKEIVREEIIEFFNRF